MSVRYALRSLRKNPGFTAAAVATLTLGIGAATAIFSIVNGLLLRPLPYPNPERIVSIGTAWRDPQPRSLPLVSAGDFTDLQTAHGAFDELGLYVGGEIGVQTRSGAEFTGVYAVNAQFTRVFSVNPAFGRALEDSDTDRAALVSIPFATRIFGSAAQALGKSITVDREAFEIVGIMPAQFNFPRDANVWCARRPWTTDRTSYNYRAVGKLSVGESLDSVRTRLDALAAHLAGGKTFFVTPLGDQLTRSFRTTLLTLMAAVSLVLLIACANVANLLFARDAGRSREIAIRTALGASRWHIRRQLALESLILAASACALGLVLAAVGLDLLLRLLPENLPRIGEVRLDRMTFCFAAAISFLSTLLFGLAPAWRASRIDLKSRHRFRHAVVVAEIALSVVLVVGAGLFFRSFLALSSVDLGFRTEGRLLMYAHMPAHGLDESVRVAASIDRMLPEFSAIPGVQSAGAAMGVPTGRYLGFKGVCSFEGSQSRNPPSSHLLLASPNYFATMGIPLLSGREFSGQDLYDRPFVAIVNQALVRQSFGGENPIGKLIKCRFDAPNKWMTIVGVVGNTVQESPASRIEPQVYMPLPQHPYFANEFEMVLRTLLPPASVIEPARQKMRQLNPATAVQFTTLNEMVASSIATPRLRAFLTAAFGALAMALAMIGVYGVMNYLTLQRTSEFGVRLALGARRSDLILDVLRGATILAIAGLAIGASVAIACGRLVASLLFGLSPEDPVTYAVVFFTMLAAALIAAAVPAIRAANVDPIMALRHDSLR